MNVILENQAAPEQGTVEIKVNLLIEIKVTAYQAQRKVDRWLMEFVSVIMGADPPTLVISGNKAVWRAPAHLRFPGMVVGTVDVDAMTGEMNNTPERQAEIEQCAKKWARRLAPTKIREVPPEYQAYPLARKLIVTEDGEIRPADPEG